MRRSNPFSYLSDEYESTPAAGQLSTNREGLALFNSNKICPPSPSSNFCFYTCVFVGIQQTGYNVSVSVSQCWQADFVTFTQSQPNYFKPLCWAKLASTGCCFLFKWQISKWHQSFHLTLCKKANKPRLLPKMWNYSFKYLAASQIYFMPPLEVPTTMLGTTRLDFCIAKTPQISTSLILLVSVICKWNFFDFLFQLSGEHTATWHV